MSILAGDDGVFATASLLGITITPEQKVIEVLDRRENILEEEEEDQIVIEGEERIEELPIDDDNNGSELAERMEICPSIPMFDLAGLATLAQWHGQQERGGEGGEEVPEGPVENEVDTSSLPSVVTKPIVSPFSTLQDYYICKLSSCQTMIMFENCGARSKILNHYTSHFQVRLSHEKFSCFDIFCIFQLVLFRGSSKISLATSSLMRCNAHCAANSWATTSNPRWGSHDS